MADFGVRWLATAFKHAQNQVPEVLPLKNQEEYNNERYIGYLKNLPDLPFDEE